MEQLHLGLKETMALTAVYQSRIPTVRTAVMKLQVIVRIARSPDNKRLLLPQILKVFLQPVQDTLIPFQQLFGARHGTLCDFRFQLPYYRQPGINLLAPLLQFVVVFDLLPSILPHDCVILGIAQCHGSLSLCVLGLLPHPLLYLL